MVKRKRRPGGGAKPLGEVAKSATFTTRIEPATRSALNEAAKLSGQSVSAMAEFILRQGLKQPAGEPRNNAVAAAIALLAENIEAGTKAKLADRPVDRICFMQRGRTFVTALYAGPGTRRDASGTSGRQRSGGKDASGSCRQFCKPHFFGRELAQFLILEIEQASSSATPNEWSMPIFFSAKPAQASPYWA